MEQDSWKILSSSEGVIQEILIIYEDSLFYRSFLKELLIKLSDQVRLYIWVSDSELLHRAKEQIEETKQNSKLENRIHLLFFESKTINNRLSIWVQDPMLVLNSSLSQRIKLLKPYETTQYTNRILPEYLEEVHPNIEKEYIKWLRIDGGNILVGDDFILIGELDFWAIRNKLQKQNELKDLTKYTLEKISKLLDSSRDIIVVGTNLDEETKLTRGRGNLTSIWDFSFWGGKRVLRSGELSGQADVHIDLFLSLAGRLNGDPNNKYVLLIGRPINLVSNKNMKAQEMLLIKIVEKLEKAGFMVLRNPIPIVKDISGNIIQAFYNNCLVEIDSGKRKVWLSKYDSRKLQVDISVYEQENVNIWKSLGFEVQFIEADFVSLSRQGGGIHCLTKCLRRI